MEMQLRQDPNGMFYNAPVYEPGEEPETTPMASIADAPTLENKIAAAKLVVERKAPKKQAKKRGPKPKKAA